MSDCCTKCRVDGEFENELCHNENCPCHSTEEKEELDDILRNTDIDIPFQEEKAFVGMVGGAEMPLISVKGDILEVKKDDLIKYQQNLLAADHAALRAKVEARKYKEPIEGDHVEQCLNWNAALDDVLRLLQD